MSCVQPGAQHREWGVLGEGLLEATGFTSLKEVNVTFSLPPERGPLCDGCWFPALWESPVEPGHMVPSTMSGTVTGALCELDPTSA